MSDDVIENPEILDAPQEPVTTEPEAPQESSFDYVLDKYRSEGRSEEESAFEQAKAYGELQKRFGGFTGAPEEYELSLSEKASELGVEMDMDSPIFSEMMEVAKELNMSNEAFNQFSEVMVKNALAEKMAFEENLVKEIESLHNGSARIEQINGFVEANLSPEAVEAFQEMPQSAAQVEAIEQLIGLVKGGSNAPTEANTFDISDEEIKSMQFEKDEFGNRRLHSDPAFRAEYQRKLNMKHGTQPHRQQIG
ncbi:MAG: hypothetical protein GY746_10830 [Gammaproteobacteria bacterium]|nr:hypothetical protein [Gammaproteobacteria bacterium]